MEILQEELREYYNSLITLGFEINCDDILDVNVDKNDVRVSYKVLEQENDFYVVKDKMCVLNEVPAVDFINAYNYVKMVCNENLENKVDSEELLKAIKVIAEVVKYEDEKIRLNNLLVDELKKANNSGKFELVTRDENVDEDSNLIIKGKEFLKNNVAYIAGAALVGGAIVYAAFGNKQNTVSDPSNTFVQEESNVNEEEIAQDTNTEEVVESDVTLTNENTATEVAEEEVEVAFDINNEEAINATVDKIYNEVQAMDDENFKAEMDKDTIEALVRYTRHNNSKYTGMNIISNEYAYEILSEFFNQKYNIANFYENLDNYDKLNDLVTKSFAIKQEKDSYEDEIAVYQSLDYAMNTLDSENYPEVIALRAVVDNITVLDSMKLVGGIGTENGLEGDEYYTEKAKAANVDAKEVFNKVDINNENAPLTQATYKAIEEDETLGLSR